MTSAESWWWPADQDDERGTAVATAEPRGHRAVESVDHSYYTSQHADVLLRLLKDTTPIGRHRA